MKSETVRWCYFSSRLSIGKCQGRKNQGEEMETWICRNYLNEVSLMSISDVSLFCERQISSQDPSSPREAPGSCGPGSLVDREQRRGWPRFSMIKYPWNLGMRYRARPSGCVFLLPVWKNDPAVVLCEHEHDEFDENCARHR